VYAQPGQQRQDEEDVVYLKDGGILRGKIIGRAAKTGRIQLRDGSVFVYQKANVKMLARESLQSSPRIAKEDSLRIAGITRQVLAKEIEAQRIKEEINDFQRIVDSTFGVGSSYIENEKTPLKIRLYSVVDVSVGIGFGDLPIADGQSTLTATANDNKLLGVRYVVGGRGDYFGIGFNLGIQRFYRMSAIDTSATSLGSASLKSGNMPSSSLFLPLGLEMRVELMPKRLVSPFIAANAAYALSLNSSSNKNGYVILNPALGVRFGRSVGSLLSAGFQFKMGSNLMNFFSLRFGLIF
jgi:hypothetical protein